MVHGPRSELSLVSDPNSDAMPALHPGLGTLNMASVVSEGARMHPAWTAILCEVSGSVQRTTYGELWAAVCDCADGLEQLGVRKGDRVAVVLPNDADFVVAYYATLALGAVVVPLNIQLTASELEFIFQSSSPTVAITSATLLKAVQPAANAASTIVAEIVGTRLRNAGHFKTSRREAIYPSNPLDPATILFTSGTTGSPKGVVGSHFAVMEQVNVALIDVLDLREGDVVFGALPLSHTFGQTVVLNATLRRGGAVLLTTRFDPVAAIDLCIQEQVVAFYGVPAMFIALLNTARVSTGTLPSFRYCVSGGAALPAAVHEAFADQFDTIVQEGYGLTETSPIATSNLKGLPGRVGSVGQPVWGVEVRVVQDLKRSSTPLPHGTTGEVIVRGHNLFKGYLSAPELTKSVIHDGFLRTGDIGQMGRDGYLTILGREDDLIITNGYNVYPTEIEAVLLKHPNVVQAAVFQLPNAHRGADICAAIVLNEDAYDGPAVGTFVRSHMARYKCPRHYFTVDAFPLGPTGKVQRDVLAKTFWPSAAQP